MTTVQTKVLFCIFIDNKTTDGDLVDSRRHGAVLLRVSSDPMCKQDGITIEYLQENISSEKGKVSLRVLENIHSLNKYTVSKATSFEKPQPNTDQNRITTGSTESRRSHSLAYTHAQSYRDSQLQRNKVSHAHAYRKRDKKPLGESVN